MIAVAKRPRFSRWRRLPGVFRTGENRPTDSGTELDRIILYVPARILDLAEKLAEKAGVSTVQDYCALLLMQALENERVRQRVADFEARRGPLEGLKQIADDPAYLAEWQERSDSRDETPPAASDDSARANAHSSSEPLTIDVVVPETEARSLAAQVERTDLDAVEDSADFESPPIDDEPPAGVVPIITLNPTVRLMNDKPIDIIWRHVGSGDDDLGFLPCLRRGEAVPGAKVAELARALNQLEEELRSSDVLERRLAHALHRLALESQVLLTDAWPGAFDERVIAAIRTVQESVERILSGQDIRYYPPPATTSTERTR
jgi:hypothetical protein